jgi:DNA-binding transcriptional MerR regulator
MIKNWLHSLSSFSQFLWAGSNLKLTIKDKTLRGSEAPVVIARILAYNESLKRIAYLKSGYTIEQMRDVADAQIELERIKTVLSDLSEKYAFATEGEKVSIRQEQRELEKELSDLSKKAANLDATISLMAGLTSEQQAAVEKELKLSSEIRLKCVEGIFFAGSLSGELNEWLNQPKSVQENLIFEIANHEDNAIDNGFFGLILSSVQKRKRRNLGPTN